MAERAVQALNHRHLGSRYIEVFQASEAEASQASAAPNTAGAQTSGGWQAEGVLPPGSNVCASALPRRHQRNEGLVNARSRRRR
jgi:hypothetical protein